MSKSNGLIHKINRAFLLQGLLITLAVVLGVFFAKIVIEQILIKNAILEEESYFWQQYQRDPSFPLPDTKNLTGYFDSTLLPEQIQRNIPQEEGFYEYGKDEDGLVMHISQAQNQTLYLLYYRGQVDALVLYYGIFPLLTVLLILYLSLWLTYSYNRRTVSP
ncbi:MAG: sensor histidine kinase, partial [Gammaproteobacteria bacterium]|nr:sensor histidine kinase [Gammaproteobacteria bacterium]